MFKMRNTLTAILNNQRGSLLLSVFGISVVLGLIVYSLFFLMSESKLNQAQRDNYQAYKEMLASLRSQIEDPYQCHKIMSGIKTPGFWKTQKAEDLRVENKGREKKKALKLTWLYDRDSTTTSAVSPSDYLQPGWKMAYSPVTIKDVYIEYTGKMQVLVPNKADPTKFDLKDRKVNMGVSGVLKEFTPLTLRLFLEPKDMGVNFGTDSDLKAASPETLGRLLRRENEIRFVANIDENNNIYNCFGFESVGGACQFAGGAFNHAGMPEFKCQPDLVCHTVKDLITDPSSCPSPYKAFDMGVQMGVPKYMCRLCREDFVIK